MMTLLEYAEDVGKTVEEIKALCDKIGISYENEESALSDDDITLLDNELQDQVDYVDGDIDDEEVAEKLEEELTYDKALDLAQKTNIDLDESRSFEKVKSKAVKKNDTKKDFLKERKKIYKHREKLQSNEQEQDENTILYKEGMTVSDVAAALEVASSEIIKK